MTQKVLMWGNSLAIRIPRAIAKDIDIKIGTQIEFTIDNGKLILTPDRSKKYTLEQLLTGINNGNLHGEIDTGISVGKEVIE